MNRATVKRLEKALLPVEGIANELVGCVKVPEGWFCQTCRIIHATEADALVAHPAPGAEICWVHVVKSREELEALQAEQTARPCRDAGTLAASVPGATWGRP